MRLICFWCFLVGGVLSQDDGYYAPQTFRQNVGGPAGLIQPAHKPWNAMTRLPNRLETYQNGLFTPASRNDVTPQGSISEPWRPSGPINEIWGGPGPLRSPGPISPPGPISGPGPILPKIEPWRAPLQMTKEQQAAILHHKQALTSEGAFRFEYASDNGLAAGEVIEPDGSRVGAYQYKDPTGQLVKLKYRAGKEGFQILEGSHLPKSPEPVAPPTQEQHYVNAYEQQRQQYDLQQKYNLERPQPQQQQWGQNDNQQGYEGQQKAAGQVYQTWRPGQEDDGQYRENEIEDSQNRGPHSFGGGYSFSFQG